MPAKRSTGPEVRTATRATRNRKKPDAGFGYDEARFEREQQAHRRACLRGLLGKELAVARALFDNEESLSDGFRWYPAEDGAIFHQVVRALVVAAQGKGKKGK